jgi:translation initiation factor IF-2
VRGPARPAPPPGGPITLPRVITVRDLSEQLKVPVVSIIKELMKLGIMASINQTVDYEQAATVSQAFGYEPSPDADADSTLAEHVGAEEDEADLQLRPPVVTVMGHVDHGKTSLLDAIRKTNVAAGEFGAITQHIGAYQVEVNGHKITFIDTPGHEAFTAMRARGATVTDIVVIVVAADDGIMPQTVEAIDHARAAEVPMIVAINKVDLPAANPDRVKQQLTQQGVVIEDYGGDVPAIEVSAKTGAGLDDLLEHILLVAEISELKANPNRAGEGVIVESKKEPNRGPMATVIVQRGTLRIGDIVVAGSAWGKVKAMFDDHGQRITEAPPAFPAELMGLDSVPKAGDPFRTVADERTARDLVTEREREGELGQRGVSLESMSGDIKAGRIKDLNIVLKADANGSVEAIRASLEKLHEEDVRVNIIHAAVGNVSESDVMLATASKAIIVAFNVKVEPGGKLRAEAEGIDLRHYRIIYELLEDIEKAVKGLMEPVIIEVTDGHAEVRAVFRVRGGRIAGCFVLDGAIRRTSNARVIRDGEVVHDSRVSSLKRFTDDVREVAAGLECGIGVERFDGFKEGDVIEAFHTEQKG